MVSLGVIESTKNNYSIASKVETDRIVDRFFEEHPAQLPLIKLNSIFFNTVY
jgi:hypothetical protein